MGIKYTSMAIKKDGREAQNTKTAVLEIREALNRSIEKQNEEGENIPGKPNESLDHLLNFLDVGADPDLSENWPM